MSVAMAKVQSLSNFPQWDLSPECNRGASVDDLLPCPDDPVILLCARFNTVKWVHQAHSQDHHVTCCFSFFPHTAHSLKECEKMPMLLSTYSDTDIQMQQKFTTYDACVACTTHTFLASRFASQLHSHGQTWLKTVVQLQAQESWKNPNIHTIFGGLPHAQSEVVRMWIYLIFHCALVVTAQPTHQNLQPLVLDHMKENHEGSNGQFPQGNHTLPPAVPGHNPQKWLGTTRQNTLSKLYVKY